MVAADEDEVAAVREVDELPDAIFRIWPPIDDIAQDDDGILGLGIDCCDQIPQGDAAPVVVADRDGSLDGCFSCVGVTKGEGSSRPSLQQQRPNSTSRPGLRSEPHRNEAGGRPIRTRSTST